MTDLEIIHARTPEGAEVLELIPIESFAFDADRRRKAGAAPYPVRVIRQGSGRILITNNPEGKPWPAER